MKRNLPSCRCSLHVVKVFYLQVILLWQLKGTFVPLCAMLFGYTASKVLFICILLIKHTHIHTRTHTHLLLSLSITPSVRRALLQDFTCSEGCFPPFLDTAVCSAFSSFVCIIEHYFFFSTHTDCLAARVFHSALIHRVWNCLLKSFLL